MSTSFSRRDAMLAGASLLAASALPGRVFAQAGSPFRVGSLCPVTGAGSPYGSGMQKAIEIAVAEVNAAGGAGGSKLELFTEDSQTKPDAAVLAAKKLIEVNKVQAILGTWSSGVTLAVMPLTDAASIIEMNTSGAPAISHARQEGPGLALPGHQRPFRRRPSRRSPRSAASSARRRWRSTTRRASATPRASRRPGRRRAARSSPASSTNRTGRATAPSCSRCWRPSPTSS